MTKTAGPSPASCAERSRPQTAQRSRTVSSPSNSFPRPQRGQRLRSAAASAPPAGRGVGSLGCVARAPPVDADEEEEPHHVDEVPVPRRRLEAEMMVGLEVALVGAEPADDEEGRADDDVEAVEAG